MVARSAAQRAASLRNLAKARVAIRGKSTTSAGRVKTASANDVTGTPRSVRYRTPRLRKVRIKL